MPDTLPNAPEEPNSHRKHGDSLQCHFNSVVRISRAPGWRSFRGIDNRHNSLHRPDKNLRRSAEKRLRMFGSLRWRTILMFPIAVLPVEPQKEQNEHQAQQSGENPMREHVKDIRHFKVDLYRRVSMPTTIGAARVGVRFRLRAA